MSARNKILIFVTAALMLILISACASAEEDAAQVKVTTVGVIGNPNIYDRAIIERVGDLAQIQLKILQWVDKIRG